MGRSPCCDKELGLKKGPWTPEEDELLTHYMHIHGPGNWRAIPTHAGLQRCGKSCRLRWTNYLRPDIKRGKFSFEEEETIIHLHSILGNKWSAIAGQLPGRTDNEIKNYWNTHAKKRLLKMGIDPVTHSPRLDLLNLSSIVISAQQNLSNLLGLQALMNPELLRIVSTLNSSNSNLLPINSELITILSQLKLFQENQFVDFQMQNHNQFNQFLNQNNLNNQQESTPRFEQANPMDFTTFDSIMTSAHMNSVSSTLIEEDGKEISQYSSSSMLKFENIPENLDFDFM